MCIFISAIYEAVLTAARRTAVFAIHDLEKLQQAFEIQATNTGPTVCFQHATNVTERFQPQNDARGRGHRVNTRIQNAAKLSFSIFLRFSLAYHAFVLLLPQAVPALHRCSFTHFVIASGVITCYRYLKHHKQYDTLEFTYT